MFEIQEKQMATWCGWSVGRDRGAVGDGVREATRMEAWEATVEF